MSYTLTLNGTALPTVTTVRISNNDTDPIYQTSIIDRSEELVEELKTINDNLSKISEKLAILKFNEELEEKWTELKKLRKQYMDLEKEILEKEQIWATLKK